MDKYLINNLRILKNKLVKEKIDIPEKDVSKM